MRSSGADGVTKLAIGLVANILKVVCAIGLSIIGVNQSKAANWPETRGWAVFGQNGSCGMYQARPSSKATFFLIALTIDNELRIRVHNASWDFAKNKEYDVDFAFDNEIVSLRANGVETSDGMKGIFATVSGDWLSRFADAATVTVRPAHASSMVLDISGISEAISTLKQCAEDLRVKSGLQNAVSTEAIPTSGLGITGSDYPERARSERRTGTSEYLLEIDERGVPTKCDITKSSGSSDLDLQTCTVLLAKARFSPARDKYDKAIPSTYQSSISWQLP